MSTINASSMADSLQTLQQIFSRSDTDKNGSLSGTEFTSAVQNVSGLKTQSTGDVSNLFKQMDTNGDGQLSSTELSDGIALAEKVRDALLKAQELMSGSTLMNTITAHPDTSETSTDISGMFDTGSGSSGSSSQMNGMIQQLMANYKSTADATGITTGATTTDPTTGITKNV